MGYMLNDWDVVREYLSAHGEATYVELRDVLSARGYRTNSIVLLIRVKRWEREGLVAIDRRGEDATAYVRLLIPDDLDASGVPLAPDAHTVRNGNDSQLQLPILELEDESMPIVVRAQSYEPLPTGEYRVELSAIEEVDTQYGKQLKWTFSVPDENRTLTAYSSISPSVKSKCMQWACVLLNRAIKSDEEVDFEKLVGRSAIATVMRKRKDDGTEYNTVDDLLPLRKTSPNEEDPFA